MKKKNREKLSYLEKQWLAGTISPSEAALYARWYNWKQNDKVVIPENIATDETQHKRNLFSKIVDQLDKEGNRFKEFYEKKQKIHLRKYLFIRYGIAASVIILCVIAVFINRSTKQIVEKIEDAAPGKSGLILTLNNGQQIMLDSVKDGLISEENGVRVFKKNGQLHYEGNGSEGLQNTASTDFGRQYRIILPDQSKVWLNAKSELKYPISFSSKERKVYLKGEAYFEIQHTEQNTPFIVESANKIIKVLGTHFDINAYGDRGQMVTTLLEGAVSVTSQNNVKKIKPDQAAVCSLNGSDIAVKKVDAAGAIMWIDRKFNFDDMTLEDIMNQIERWYGIEIVYGKDVDKTMKFNGTTPMNQNLSEVLKVLELSGIHFKLNNKVLNVIP